MALVEYVSSNHLTTFWNILEHFKLSLIMEKPLWHLQEKKVVQGLHCILPTQCF